MGKTVLIIKREYLTRVRKKSFLIMTLLGPLITAGLIATMLWLGLSESQNQKILIVDDTGGSFQGLTQERGLSFEYVEGLTLDKAQLLVHESDYTAVLFIPENFLESCKGTFFFKNGRPDYKSRRLMEDKLTSITRKYRMQESKISMADLNRVTPSISLGITKLVEPGEEEEVDTEGALIGYYFGVMIYLFIFMYGVMVMRGVIEEKTSRIVEVMISSVKPFQLMMGKILGIALVALTQFALWVMLTGVLIFVVQAVVFSQYDPDTLAQTLQQMTPDVQQQYLEDAEGPSALLDRDNPIFHVNWPLSILFFFLYFVGGYFLYSALFAAIGSAVDQEADTQQFMLPVTMPLIFALVASSVVIANPDSSLGFWLSQIPLTSPVVMMVRITSGVGAGGVPLWELLLSLTLLYASFIGATWMAGRIYRTGILMYGKKVTWKELFKWLTYR